MQPRQGTKSSRRALPIARRLVIAIRLFRQRVAGDSIGTGAAAAAGVAELASATLGLQLVGVAALAKQLGMLIDIDHRVTRETAALDRQESAGTDAAGVADEHHALAVVHAQRGPLPMIARRSALRIAPLLEHKSAVMRRFGRLDRIGLVPRIAADPCYNRGKTRSVSGGLAWLV